MTYFHALILGLVQGLTEFIPVSSSGHLVIARDLLGLPIAGLAFDAVLQLATAFAVLLYFRKDIIDLVHSAFFILLGKPVEENKKIILSALALGTVPAMVAGLLLESYMETLFRSVLLVGVMLIFGALLMFIAEYMHKRRNYEEDLTPIKGFVIGLFQCLALIPGVSRSGSTISGGLFSGLSREMAARFSFLLSFPILFGSGLKKLIDIMQEGSGVSSMGPLIFSSLIAFIVGLAAIHFLMKFLRSHPLSIFIWYRLIIASILFIWFI